MTAPHLPPEAQPPSTAGRQQLSSLLDGDLGDRDRLDSALAAWRLDPEARKAWHTYHLIGDVMRSEDLARSADHELAFVSQMRERLQAEAAHLAPASATPVASFSPASAPHLAGPRRWRGGAALAASVTVAAVVLWLSRAGEPQSTEDAAVVASSGVVGSASSGAAAPLAVNSAGVLRDPRLDEFLRLHQMARGGLAVGAPGGTLQRADLQMPADTGR